MITVGY